MAASRASCRQCVAIARQLRRPALPVAPAADRWPVAAVAQQERGVHNPSSRSSDQPIILDVGSQRRIFKSEPLEQMPPDPHDTPNKAIILLVASLSKLFTKLGCRSFEVEGLDRLLALLNDPTRAKEGRGLLTFANHISVLDEPLLWGGALPLSTFTRSRTTRWTLGAQDIMFTSPFTSYIFGHGQTISTNRGQGIFQHAVDRSIEKLRTGNWVHLFPEGYVNLSRKMTLRRFKWGVSRMIVESARTNVDAQGNKSRLLPDIVPVWITGFDQVMPEQRAWPRGLPRLGARISVHFGEPVSPSELAPYLDAYEHAGSSVEGAPGLDDLKTWGEQLDLSLPTVAASPEHSIFPPVTPLKIPEGGFPAPLPGSPAAIAASADSPRKQVIRSTLAGFLRMKLAELGLSVRQAKGQEGEGELVHVIEDASKDGKL